MKRISEIDAEIQRRAEHHLTQSHLVADYYRIRRRVAYPLPIDRLTIPSMPVAGIEAYPWSVWMLWDLEERIHSLGWFATRSGDERARAAVLEDVRALCRWPAYGQFDRPDLSLGHCGRLLWYAYRSWEWVREPLQEEFQTAFSRLIEEGLPLSDGMFGPYRSKADVLALEQPHTVLHNIPFIGTVGVALCAACIDHPRRGDLDERLFALLSSILDLRQDGHSEGVGYDGYILDFVAPWLGELDEDRRGEILSHPRFNDVLDESIGLGVPGDVACVAEIGDVEPREMPYHLSGHAKLLKWTGESHRSWLLNHARLDWLRTDALAAIRDRDLAIQANPVPGAIDCHYAVCLRSGWENQDLAVVVSVSNSPMSHLQCDNHLKPYHSKPDRLKCLRYRLINLQNNQERIIV